MKRKILIGIGEQGIKAVSMVKDTELHKVYIDSVPEPNQYTKDGTYISVPYSYNENAWHPEEPIKCLLRDTHNASELVELLSEAEHLIIVNGVGGSQSIVATELMKFCKKHLPDVPMYFVGSFPFSAETKHYRTNIITEKVMRFLRRNEIAYSMLENNALFLYLSTYDEAYNVSHQGLAETVQSMLYLLKNKELKKNAEDLLNRGGPIFTLEISVDINKGKLPRLENPLLPYQCRKNTAFADIYLEGRLDEQRVQSVQQLLNSIEAELGQVDGVYRSGGLHSKSICHVSIWGQGAEQPGKLCTRKLKIFNEL